MIGIEGQPILTVAQVRAAEHRAAPTPEAMYALMERAGAGVAEAVQRLAVGAETLILCGPGNNGGDGYVAARVLRDRGHPVRVAALTPPRTALARKAASTWTGPVAHYTTGDQTRTGDWAWNGERPEPAPVLVDALFGTGGTADHAGEPWVAAFQSFFDRAHFTIAVDLPLGLSAAGEYRRPFDRAAADVTLALGALKPAHVLPSVDQPCGEVRFIDLGLDLADASVRVTQRPAFKAPGPWTHKYTRGMVGIVAGAMPGAARLAALAAARAGAGYVTVFGDAPGGPDAIVHRPLTREALSDHRLNVVVIGPGLGRSDDARNWLKWLITQTDRALVIDGDALHLLDPTWLVDRWPGVVLTPHAGEHRALTGHLPSDEDRTADPFGAASREVSTLAGGPHVVVAKGATTVIADGRHARVAPRGNAWLSTAGTGDVLAGAVAATLAAGRHADWTPLDAAEAGVWLHAEAARRCGASFIADDLAHALTAARASCR